MRWAGAALLFFLGLLLGSPVQAAPECPVPAVGQVLVCTRELGNPDVVTSVLVPGVVTPVSTGAATATLDVITQINGSVSDPKPMTTITKRAEAPEVLPVSVEVLIGLPGDVTMRHGYDARQSTAPQSIQLSVPVINLASSQVRLQTQMQTASPLTLLAGAGVVDITTRIPQPLSDFEVGVQALPSPRFEMSSGATFDAGLTAALPGLTTTLTYDDVPGKGTLSVPSAGSFAWTSNGASKAVDFIATYAQERLQAGLESPPAAAGFALQNGTLRYQGSGPLPGVNLEVRRSMSFGSGTLGLRYLRLTGSQMPHGTAVDLANDANGVGLSAPGGQTIGRLSLLAKRNAPPGPGGVITIDPGNPDDFGIPAKDPVVVRVLDPFQTDGDTVEISVFDMRNLRVTQGDGFGLTVDGGQGRRLVFEVDATDYNTMEISSDAATPQTFSTTLDTLPGMLRINVAGPQLRYEASGPVSKVRLVRDDRRTYDARDMDVLATGLPPVIEAQPVPGGGYRVDASAPVGSFAARVSANRALPAIGFGASEDGLRIIDTPDRYEMSVRATGLKKAFVGTANGVALGLEHGSGRDLLVSVDQSRPQEFSELRAEVRARSLPATVQFTSAGRGFNWTAGSPVPRLSGFVDRRQGNGPSTRRIARFEVKDLPASVQLSAGGEALAALETSGPIGRLRVATGGPEVSGLPEVGPKDLVHRVTDSAIPGVTAVLRGVRSFRVERADAGQARFELKSTAKRQTVLRNTAGAKTMRLGLSSRPSSIETGVVPDRGNTGGIGIGPAKVIGKKFVWRASSGIATIRADLNGIDLLKQQEGAENASLTVSDLPKRVQLRFTQRISFEGSGPVGVEGSVRTDRVETIPYISLPKGSDGVTVRSAVVADAKNKKVKHSVSSLQMRLMGIEAFSVNLKDLAVEIKRDKPRRMFIKQRVTNHVDRLVTYREVDVRKVPATLQFRLDRSTPMRARYRASSPIASMTVDVRDLDTNGGRRDRFGLFVDVEDVPREFRVCWHGGGRDCAPVYAKARQLKGNLDFDILMSTKPIKVGSLEFVTDGSTTMTVDAEICSGGGRCSEDGGRLTRGVKLRNAVIPQRLALEAHFEQNSFLIGQISSGNTRPMQGWVYLDTDNQPISADVTLAQYNQKAVKEVRLKTASHRTQDYVSAFSMYNFLKPATWRSQTTGSWQCSGTPSVELVLGINEVKLLKNLSSLLLSRLC
jgi:hypothetical protein